MNENENNTMEQTTGFNPTEETEDTSGTPLGLVLGFAGLVIGGIAYGINKLRRRTKYHEVHHRRFGKVNDK